MHPDQLAKEKMLKDGNDDNVVFTTTTEDGATPVNPDFYSTSTPMCFSGCSKKREEVPLRSDSDDRLQSLIDQVIGWHHARNLICGSTDKDQTVKLLQELGELSDNVCKNLDIRDDIGDMLVVLINIAERNGLSLADCLQKAWDDIKDRKGKMVDGIFVKEQDL
jgi:hypothetical protein